MSRNSKDRGPIAAGSEICVRSTRGEHRQHPYQRVPQQHRSQNSGSGQLPVSAQNLLQHQKQQSSYAQSHLHCPTIPSNHTRNLPQSPSQASSSIPSQTLNGEAVPSRELKIKLAEQESDVRVKILVNAFAIEIEQKKKRDFIYVYDVVITQAWVSKGATGAREITARAASEKKTSKLSIEIIETLQKQRPDLFTPRAAYDGNKILYARRLLPLDNGKDFYVDLSGKEPHSPAKGPGKGIYLVTLALSAKTIDLSAIPMLVAGPPRDDQAEIDLQESVNAVQIFLRQAPMIKGAPFNSRSVFASNDRRTLNNGIELWRGYFQSVRPTIGKLIVNVDVTAALFYPGGPVYDFANRYLGVSSLSNLHGAACDGLSSALIGMDVRLKGGMGRTRRVTGIVWEGSRRYEFTFKQGQHEQHMTVEEYWHKMKRVVLEHPTAFALAFHRDRSVVVPGELCIIPHGQFVRRSLYHSSAQEMIRFATTRPDKRLENIQAAIAPSGFLGYQNSEFVGLNGINVSSEPLEVSGTLLRPPGLIAGLDPKTGQNSYIDNRDSRGVWNYIGKKLHTVPVRTANDSRPIPFNFAVIDYINHPANDVRRFLENLQHVCHSLGMRIIFNPSISQGNASSPHQAFQALQSAGERPDLVLVFLPESAEVVRKSVKIWGDCEVGVPTQCVRKSGLLKGLPRQGSDQYLRNLALKINVKLGGKNSVPFYPEVIRDLTAHGSWMIVGADVTHPGPGVIEPSIASIVASVNQDHTRYSTFFSVQSPRMEIIEELRSMMKNALIAWYRRNGGLKVTPPKNIVFYRDGVSEGEYDMVRRHEVSAIRGAFEDFYNETEMVRDALKGFVTGSFIPMPDLIFIVVGKRHHVRFFPGHQTMSDHKGNVHGGVVVNSGVTSVHQNDFYLLSHKGLQGTSKPAHYIVLERPLPMPIDFLIKLSYYLCFCYARATRAVSIPAPVYYADLACTRARFYFDEARLSIQNWNAADDVQWTPDFVEVCRNAFKAVVDGMSPHMRNSMFFM